MEANFEA